MSAGDPSGTLRQIQTLFVSGRLSELTDRQLLERFANRNDPSSDEAFALLLQRHGPMVWGVCRRTLVDRDASADAFQATFLVLARRASAIRVHDSLGPWLYGVSRRVAARARAVSLRRMAVEIVGRVETLADAAPVSDPHHAEDLAILDEEIDRLPERQRAAIVLCDLEGLPHEAAARRLGCPVGTVESRLSRGRRRLRDRLVRRGLAPAAAAAWAELAREASAAIPLAVVKNSKGLVTGSRAAVPFAVNALAQGVIPMMWLAKLKPVLAIAAASLLVTAGVAVQGRQSTASKESPQPTKTATQPEGAAARQALARKQLDLIDKALAMLHQLGRNSRVHFGDAAFSLWGTRKLETLRKTGAKKEEIVAAVEDYIKVLRQEEAIAESQHENARGTKVDVYDVQFRIMEAESFLNEEKSR